MIRSIAILLACSVPVVSFGQQVQTDLYEQLEGLYADVIEVYLRDRGLECPGRTVGTEEKQQQLAEMLSGATTETGERVLLFAVTANSLDDVIRLNEAGASRTGDNGSLLHSAATFADPPILEYLVSIGFGLEDYGGAGGSALLVAASENRIENVAWLIENGADVNAASRSGGIVLRHALVCRDQALIDYLLEAGAVPDEATIRIAERLGLSVDLQQ